MRRTVDPWNEVIRPRLVEVTAWARDGLSDKDIAKKLGIARSCFMRHKRAQEELQKALAEGKEYVDITVENALLKKARGYTYNEITQEADDKGHLHVTKVVKKEVQPDVAAAMAWLVNRTSKWHHAGSVPQDNTDALAKLEELRAAIRDDLARPVDDEAQPAAGEDGT